MLFSVGLTVWASVAIASGRRPAWRVPLPAALTYQSAYETTTRRLGKGHDASDCRVHAWVEPTRFAGVRPKNVFRTYPARMLSI